MIANKNNKLRIIFSIAIIIGLGIFILSILVINNDSLGKEIAISAQMLLTFAVYSIVLYYLLLQFLIIPVEKLYYYLEKADKGELSDQSIRFKNTETGKLGKKLLSVFLAKQNVEQEYEMLNLSLEKMINDHQILNLELEKIIEERTSELSKSNFELSNEMQIRQGMEKQLLFDASHDNLTKLPNRVLFLDRLSHAIVRKKRNPEFKFAVMFLDLDRFKVINDSLGHSVGDQLLIEVARKLEKSVREVDLIARLGGDEFTVLLEDIDGRNDVEFVAERIMKEFADPIEIGEHNITSSPSIGLIISDEAYKSSGEYIRDADTAMYAAKANGKGRVEWFSNYQRKAVLGKLNLEEDIRRGMKEKEFFVHYQPILSLFTAKITGFEALIRWNHPEKGIVNPDDFLPLAEETGLIIPMGKQMRREACQQLAVWQKKYQTFPILKISLNLSNRELLSKDLLIEIEDLISEMEIDGESLNLEMTEGIVVLNSDYVVSLLDSLRNIGVSIHMDDFGTGHSSLGYLHNLPMDIIKIDKTFISRMNEENNHPGLVRTIISMAKEFGMQVVAEGIETEGQMEMLQGLGCNYGQGYLIARPENAQKIDERLAKQTVQIGI